jgi:hypothetical protein
MIVSSAYSSAEELIDYRLAGVPLRRARRRRGFGPKTWWRTHCSIWRIFCTAIPS